MKWYILNQDIKSRAITNSEPKDYQQVKQSIETNTNDISTIRNDLGDLGNEVNNNVSQIETLKQETTHLNQSKQDNLINGTGINLIDNTISITLNNSNDINYNQQDNNLTINETIKNSILTNTESINSLNGSQTQQDTKISQNKALIDQVINELKQSTFINYVGQYQSGNTYHLGNVVSFNNELYLCKVETTTNEPTNTNDWDIISNVEVDLSNYYNKLEVDNKLTNYTTNESLEQAKQQLNNSISSNTTKINQVEQNLNSKQNTIDNQTILNFKKWDLGDNISLFKYSNNELVINYNQKLSFIDTNDRRVTFLENGEIENYANKNYVADQINTNNQNYYNKSEIDQALTNKITRQVINKTIRINEDNVIAELGNYISIQVLRKRNDNKWFLYDTQNTSQVFIEGTTLKIWGVQNDNYTNEFQIIITTLN